MNDVVIPSIHYLAILPVLIFFGAALALLLASALARGKVPLDRRDLGGDVAAAVATLVVDFFQWRCVARAGASIDDRPRRRARRLRGRRPSGVIALSVL